MLPVGDFVRRRTTPFVNYALLVANFAVFVYMLTLDQSAPVGAPSELDEFIFDWAFVPACVADQLGFDTDAPQQALVAVCPTGNREVLQIFSSMFVHAGWAHIFGNMLFLWIFGDNVEDRMGHLTYLLFYLVCGAIASAAQIAVSPDTIVPSVGASGAIAGVLGAYLILYPKAIVSVVVVPLFFIPFFVPAILVIGMWFITQLFAGLAELGSNTTAGSGIAWWAHIGGFVAGVILIWPLKRGDRPRDAYKRQSG